MPRARLISQLNVNERVVAEAVGGGKGGGSGTSFIMSSCGKRREGKGWKS